MNETISKIVSILFMARTYGHIAHLKTPSYAQHKALDGFYNEAGSYGDQLAEQAQGKYGKLEVEFLPMKGSVDDPVGALETQLTMIENLAKKAVSDPVTDNILQEVQAMYRKTLYFLKELK